MVAGAAAELLIGEISWEKAIHAINPDVMIFLFGMFVVGEAVYMSGILARISFEICRLSRTSDHLMFSLIPVMAASSAILMNDTVAIIGTPLVISLASRYKISPKSLLLILCFSLTTGSVCSPIGNPQNLLLVMFWNPPNPFLTFAYGLFIPTIISLLFIFVVMRTKRFPVIERPQIYPDLPICHDRRLIFVTLLSLLILLTLIVFRITGFPSGNIFDFSLGWIAMASAIPVLLFVRQRNTIIRRIDWRTLIFFAAMFVLMQGVYETGWFQSVVPFSQITSVPLILVMSISLSQFISNVPFIALFEPILVSAGTSSSSLLALAAGSTIAGNLTILGAASNIIVIQKAEQAGVILTFRDFLSVGLPLTLIQGSVYAIWLLLFK